MLGATQKWHKLYKRQWIACICTAFDSSLVSDPELVGHGNRKCYSDFTHKAKIKRLTETVQSDNTSKQRRKSSDSMPSGVSAWEACSTRRSTQNWDLCMFCQEPNGKPAPYLLIITILRLATTSICSPPTRRWCISFANSRLQIRGDVIATPGHEGLDVAEAIDCNWLCPR
jgi:hypothetical protein